MPEPCVLAPEQVTEYPDSLELPEELKQQITDPAPWRAAGIAVDGADPQELYDHALSHAPGWKIGGWAPWGLTDPVPRFCVACGTAMTPLLTIASSEWHRNSTSWIPYEDQVPGPARLGPGTSELPHIAENFARRPRLSGCGRGEVLGDLPGGVRAQRNGPADCARPAVLVLAAEDEKPGAVRGPVIAPTIIPVMSRLLILVHPPVPGRYRPFQGLEQDPFHPGEEHLRSGWWLLPQLLWASP
ncbi:hypothetical protein [Streptomyces sp. DSM 40907]|uniref:hypothetical protein n=1 Tax=Streptomyces kutzneri TaxID=3051179 RepID=UPI0028D54F19|nr:hypothetical protein [Streptomyces sp. DSM 40907]